MKLHTAIAILAGVLLSLSLFSCSGASKQSVERINTVVDSLRAAGAPDSLLAEVEILAFKAKNEMEKGGKGTAGKLIRQANKLLDQVQKQYEAAAGSASAEVNALVSDLKAKSKELTGERIAVIERGVKEIDSLSAASLVLQAARRASDLTRRLPVLLANEEKTRINQPLIVGTWVRESTDKDADRGSNSKKIENFTYRSDKTFTANQTEKGNYSDDVVLDYNYMSTGTYSLNGDSIRYKIDRIRGFNRNKAQYKGKWVQNEKAGFDSAVGQASQAELTASFVTTVPDLKQHFNHR